MGLCICLQLISLVSLSIHRCIHVPEIEAYRFYSECLFTLNYSYFRLGILLLRKGFEILFLLFRGFLLDTFLPGLYPEYESLRDTSLNFLKVLVLRLPRVARVKRVPGFSTTGVSAKYRLGSRLNLQFL